MLIFTHLLQRENSAFLCAFLTQSRAPSRNTLLLLLCVKLHLPSSELCVAVSSSGSSHGVSLNLNVSQRLCDLMLSLLCACIKSQHFAFPLHATIKRMLKCRSFSIFMNKIKVGATCLRSFTVSLIYNCFR